MTRSLTAALVTSLLVIGSVSTAGAAVFHFDGMIDYHNDVVYTYFTLDDDATNVRIWTDSFQDGLNFDPITAIWDRDSGALLGENDDNPNVNPATQTYWDSGMEFASLGAGEYVFSIASYWNFANGSNLSDGFAFDNDNPVPIEEWWNYGTGYWSLWLDGVDDAQGGGDEDPIPEPTTLLLVGLGLPFINRLRKRR